MRSMPHPVVVVTASNPSSSEESSEASFRGMTVSSFNTVTLLPRPYVSFNIRTPSATHSALSKSGTFLVHMLSASRSGARIADAFARGTNAQGEAFQQLAARHDEDNEIQIFAGKGTQGAPLLAGDGIMRVLRCRTLPDKEVVVEDHVVLVAEVLGILSPPTSLKRGADDLSRGDSPESERGLLYGSQAYRQWGPDIKPENASAEREVAQEGTAQSPIHRTMGLNVRRGDENESRR